MAAAVSFKDTISRVRQHAACSDLCRHRGDSIARLHLRVYRTHRSESSMAAATGVGDTYCSESSMAPATAVGETYIVRRVAWLQLLV